MHCVVGERVRGMGAYLMQLVVTCYIYTHIVWSYPVIGGHPWHRETALDKLETELVMATDTPLGDEPARPALWPAA